MLERVRSLASWSILRRSMPLGPTKLEPMRFSYSPRASPTMTMGLETAKAINLPREIPLSLFKVLDSSRGRLLPRTPDVLHRVPEVEVHPFGDLNAFHTRGMGGVVRWMVDNIDSTRFGGRRSHF